MAGVAVVALSCMWSMAVSGEMEGAERYMLMDPKASADEATSAVCTVICAFGGQPVSGLQTRRLQTRCARANEGWLGEAKEGCLAGGGE